MGLCHSLFIPIAFMSLSTQPLAESRVIQSNFSNPPTPFGLATPLDTTPRFPQSISGTSPVTFILVHFFAQSFSSFRSTCPNHLNLALWILFSTHSMTKRLKSSSQRFLSFEDTLHILRTIILSALTSLARSSTFIAQVLLPYSNTLWKQALYIFPLSFRRETSFCQNWC